MKNGGWPKRAEGWPPENSKEADRSIAIDTTGPGAQIQGREASMPVRADCALWGSGCGQCVWEAVGDTAEVLKCWTRVSALHVSSQEMAGEFQTGELCARFLCREMD